MVIIVNWVEHLDSLHGELSGIRCEIMKAQDLAQFLLNQTDAILDVPPEQKLKQFEKLIFGFACLLHQLELALRGCNCYGETGKYKGVISDV